MTEELPIKKITMEHISRENRGVAKKKIKTNNERAYIERCQWSCQ
jgi:hypothetical protein